MDFSQMMPGREAMGTRGGHGGAHTLLFPQLRIKCYCDHNRNEDMVSL